MTDQQLIEALKGQKQEKAFLKLYAHYPKVEKLVREFGGTRDDAKDVYQEGLIILYNKVTAADFKLTSQLGTYLYSVCRFVWMDHLRKKGKRQEQKLNEELGVAFTDEMEETLEKESRLQRIEDTLSLVGEKCRKLLQLFYYRGKSMKEVMKMLGYASEDTAKTQKYKCLEQAKRKIDLI
jgi:RNA polymerase sigma factor (sigma-70 family)